MASLSDPSTVFWDSRPTYGSPRNIQNWHKPPLNKENGRARCLNYNDTGNHVFQCPKSRNVANNVRSLMYKQPKHTNCTQNMRFINKLTAQSYSRRRKIDLAQSHTRFRSMKKKLSWICSPFHLAIKSSVRRMFREELHYQSSNIDTIPNISECVYFGLDNQTCTIF